MGLIKGYFAIRKIVKEDIAKNSEEYKALGEANKVFSSRVRTDMDRRR